MTSVWPGGQDLKLSPGDANMDVFELEIKIGIWDLIIEANIVINVLLKMYNFWKWDTGVCDINHL